MIVYNYLLLNNRKRFSAQLAVEYAMVIAILVGALLAMQIYLKRSIQGRVREAADEIGEQYSAKTTTSDIVQSFSSNITVNADPVIMNIIDPLSGNTFQSELIFMHQAANQTSTYEQAFGGGNSWEQTGNSSAEGLYE